MAEKENRTVCGGHPACTEGDSGFCEPEVLSKEAFCAQTDEKTAEKSEEDFINETIDRVVELLDIAYAVAMMRDPLPEEPETAGMEKAEQCERSEAAQTLDGAGEGQEK